MAVGVTIFVLGVLVIAIWVIIEVKRLKHKVFAIFLIALILFTYISFSVSLKGEDIDYKTISGLITAGKLYASWLGGIFTNFKSLNAYALKQDWKTYNNSIVEEPPEEKIPIWKRI